MTPFGFVPLGTTDGSDYHGKMRDVVLDTATNSLPLFQGDMLASITPAVTDKVQRVEQADEASFTDLLGSLVEIFPDFNDEGSLIANFIAADSADRSGRVVYGSDVIYAVREDAVGGALDGADIGLAADMAASAAGDIITGISGQALDSSVAVATTGQFLLLQLDQQQGNDFAVSGGVGAIWQVTINPGATA